MSVLKVKCHLLVTWYLMDIPGPWVS